MNELDLMETTVKQVHEAFLAGRLSARELVQSCIERIRRFDRSGPVLNAVIHINEQALEAADACDRFLERSGGLSGPLHGIPVLLKDNFDTCDMPTTAGSNALRGWKPPEDAYVVKRLRFQMGEQGIPRTITN